MTDVREVGSPTHCGGTATSHPGHCPLEPVGGDATQLTVSSRTTRTDFTSTSTSRSAPAAMLLLLVWALARGARAADDAEARGKDTYLDAFMESHGSLTANSGSAASASQPQNGYANPQPQGSYPNPQPQSGYPNPQPQSGYASPQPQYGPPSAQPQYGPPSPAPQYGYPQPQYGPPTAYGPPAPTSAPVPFLEGLGAGLLSLLSQLPLPDFHTALKILLKVIVVKGVVKLISLLLVMLFIPKLESILSLAASLMDMDMGMGMGMKDKDKDKPSHHHHHHNDDDQGDDMEDMMMSDDNGRAAGSARGRMVNALAARVEEAVGRVAKSLDVTHSDHSAASKGQSSMDSAQGQHRPKKAKKKAVNKNVD